MGAALLASAAMFLTAFAETVPLIVALRLVFGAAVLLVVAAAGVSTIGETRAPREASEERAPLIHRQALPAALGFLTSIVAVGGILAFAAQQVRADHC